MPLPQPNTAWPPTELAPILADYARWDAWYVGDPDRLSAVHSQQRQQVRPSERPTQYAGGVVGAVSRAFWGRPRGDLTKQPEQKLHIPLAGDICQASADLLFADAPTFTLPDDAPAGAQDTFDRLVDAAGVIDAFAEGGELTAGLGSTYLRVTHDETLDHPIVTRVDADAALPRFRWGRLVEVTFWTVIKTSGQQVWRHLEHHELDGEEGVIRHALYQGTGDNLGHPVPLVESPALAPLVPYLQDGDTYRTGSDGLAVVHWPNLGPQRRWRTHTLGRNLGRSDLDGIEGQMDALDQAWSSWMRDIDLGKARIIAAESVLDDNGPGRGMSFDLDRSVFTSVNMLTPRDGTSLPIETVQFAIRVEEHAKTVTELVRSIARSAGYSVSTFAENTDGAAAQTATQVRSQDRRTMLTRDRKVRAVTRPLLELLLKLQRMADLPYAEAPTITWPDAVQPGLLELAQTAQALAVAQAASVETRVRMVHPEWDDEQVRVEVAAILTESSVPALPDPTDPRLGAGEDVEPGPTGTLPA